MSHFQDHRQNLGMRLLDGLLCLYPLRFRREFSAEIHGVLLSRLSEAEKRSQAAWFAAILREVTGLTVSILLECWHEMREKMNTSPEPINPVREANQLARVSFWLSLISILCIFLMMAMLFSRLSPIPDVSLPVQLILTIGLLSIPTLISIGSLITGIRSLRPGREKKQKGSWMAIFGIVFAGLQILSMVLLYRAILLDT